MIARGTVFSSRFSGWHESLGPLLRAAGLKERLQKINQPILIKPNLVETLQPPITTPVELVEALILCLRGMTDTRLLIGEGSGAMDYETTHTFSELGYTEMANRLDVELVDLNHEKLIRLQNPACRRWPEMYLPGIAMESFLISVPVLKAHSLAGATLTLKNMMGLVPPRRYCSGSWKKSAFHNRIQDAVADLNRYRTPDFTLLDATVGMARAHLWGPTCSPPVGRLVAGFDPVALDAYGTSLLKRNWLDIGHIRSLHGELGQADPLRIIDI